MKKNLYLLLLIIIAIPILINFYVCFSTSGKILKKDISLDKIDCIIVLGAGVWGDKPSPMLADRIDAGVFLYKNGISDKIIMSGDHGNKDYDEENVMKKYAITSGVPANDIFMDHAGFSTYDSIYRAQKIFKAKKVIIVTQKYHLYRALYIADKLGLEAYGYEADKTVYSGQFFREFREILARNKDFFKVILKPSSKYLGNEIPISGDGNVTNDVEL